MKTSIKSTVYLLATCSILLLGNCKKNLGSLKPPPTVDSAIVNAMYPASVTTYPGETKYEYDKDNHLVNYSRDSTVIVNIGANQVDQNVNEYTTNSNGQSVLYHVSTTSFVYNMVGQPNTSVNIYNTAPTQVTYTYFDKDIKSGITQSRPGGQLQFENNKDGLPVKEISSDGGGYNYDFTYDSNGNMQKVEFVHLSGPRAGAVYGRVTITSLDDKHSPFSAVKGYWVASFPQSYQSDYALAFCKNNPKQIISESYDTTKGAFVVYQQDDFSYVYNDKGYPTQIIINTTYYNATTTQGVVTTYNYTYK
ncbi:hypothetical protein [Mucilaginibacter sp.]|uniref:hypothetical protein n=1 Tax=Mucilaginibacter sp. TaxID=1882438 RepID=UPI00283DA927|nr:hypothetical protein [Mucilaginibacter sp.]MDR3697871.1 hypothetical protein [Mucilaginibacter sp.]